MMPGAPGIAHEHDDDHQAYERGMAKLKRLPANAEEFERWANEMLDRSRRRRR